MSAEHGHTPIFYVKIWAILLVLLVISVLGPELNIPVLTLITAFGIALVKAYMVCKHFMHLNLERNYISYMLLSMLVFVFLFFSGTAADVMKTSGQNWINEAAEQHIEDNKHSDKPSHEGKVEH